MLKLRMIVGLMLFAPLISRAGTDIPTAKELFNAGLPAVVCTTTQGINFAIKNVAGIAENPRRTFKVLGTEIPTPDNVCIVIQMVSQ